MLCSKCQEIDGGASTILLRGCEPIYQSTVPVSHLIDLSLMGGDSLDHVLGHLFLLLLGVLLGDVGKRIVCFIVATIKVIPCSVQSLCRSTNMLIQPLVC